MEKRNRLLSALFVAGALMVLAGSAVHITGWVLAPYIYTAGAVLVAVAQILTPPRKKNFVLNRLRAQQVLGALLLVAAGVLMFALHRHEWVVCLAAGAVFELYTAFRIPQEEEKA